MMSKINTKNRRPNLRTQAMHDKYMAYIEAGGLDEGCRMCDLVAIKVFEFWKIVPNKFPYDRIASAHDMLIPLRHTCGDDFSRPELEELNLMRKTYLNDNYEFIFDAVPKTKSIPDHFHLHLIVCKQI